MKSEVEVNQKLITVGDVLYYMDGSNCDKWIVKSLFEGGFIAFNTELEGEDVFFFNQLQYGWIISDNSKEKHRIEDRFIYSAI